MACEDARNPTMIDIKDIQGNVIYSTPINANSKRKCTLMQEDYITLLFSTDNPIEFGVGCYVDDANIGIFELISPYKPKYNNSTGGYNYELRLDAHYWKWRNKIFKFTPEVGGQEASWSLTASLDVHLNIFLKNLKALGYTYRGVDFEFSIDSTVENKAISMTYSNMNMLDALFSMAESWGCEVWVTENVIHFGRCEYGTAVDFEFGKNVAEMTTSESKSKYATRLYVFGSTRNLPPNYRPTDESIVVNGIVERRLMLPVGIPYIDAYEGMTEEEAIEEVVVLDDVYPKTDGNISEVTTYEDEVENEDGTTSKETFYRFKDNGITFSKDYILEGQELKVKFESGSLNGMEFGLVFNPNGVAEKLDNGSWNPDAQLFEVVVNEDYGRKLPDNTLYPKVGDKYILFGWDSSKIADLGLISKAEQQLYQEGVKVSEKRKIDPNTYTCKMFSDYMYGIDENGKQDSAYSKHFELGDKVNLINSAYFPNGRQSRIIGYEYNLDMPYDNPVYTIGETSSYSRLGELESKLDALTYAGQTYTGGNGSGVYVIGTNDTTKPSNRNVYSALRSDKNFLRKDQDDTAHGVITFENQIKSHDFAQGNLMGAGWSIYRDGNGNVVVETDRMIIRKDLSVSELIVNQETFQKGSNIYVKGGCTITRVEEADTYYRCYFDNKDGEEFSGFVVGDQARCQRYDKSYQNVIKYYWRLVVGVGDDYVDLSKTDLDGTGLPTEGDDIAQLGNRTDKTRQSAVVISPDSGGSVVIWAGIDSFNLSEKNMIGMGVDASTGEAYFYGYGNMYMGDRNQTSFMRFTKNNGVEICGSLAVGTKLGDGRDLKEAIDSATPEGYQEFVELVTNSIDNLWKEADGVVNSFFLDYDPTLDNYPAVDWTTDEQKVAHVGDTYTNIATGDSWRWELLDGSYQWKYIKDTATKKALAEASKAKDVADGKRRVFTSTPKYTDSYDVGDLWVNATYGQYSNEILKCNTAKAANVAFNIAHWSKASKYTDDSSVNALKVDVNTLSGKVDKFGTDIEAVKQQTDREYTIWFFEYEPTLNNYPASDWTTPELVAEHDQDMFYYREAGKAWRFEDGSWKLIKDQDVLRALEQIAALQTQVSDLEPLREAFKDDETLVSGGLVMASLVGVRNKENEVESFLNGSDFAKDETHGKLLLAGGIPSGSDPIEERAKAALTRIYEDGTFYSDKGIFGGYIKSNLVRILESDAIVVTGLYNNHAYKLVDNLYVDATFAEIVLPSGDKYSGARAIIIDSYFLKARLATTPTIIRDENGEGILCGLLDNGDEVEPHSISAIRIEGGAVELIHKNVIIGKNDSGGDIYESRWIVLTHSCATFEIYNG